MKNLIFFVSFLIAANVCFAIDDCGSKSGELVNITITGCENLNERCTLHRNTNVTLTMEFKTKKAIESVKSVVYGVILGVPIPFALPNPDACKDSGLECPLSADQTYTYLATMPVEKKYPKVTVDVQWELKDDKGEMILCTLIPSKIH